jgi:hypothetical protein
MALHAAAMMAFFFQQATQPQCAVQCVQAAGRDQLWARLFFAAIPSIFALGIAALVFYWNGGREHKRWVLDQKKAEWKELFSAITEVQKEFPPIYETESLAIGKEEKMAEELANKWNEIEHRIDVIAIMPFIFIAQKLIDIKFYKDWKDFKEKASKEIPSMPKLIGNRAQKQICTSTPMKQYQTGSEYRDPKSVYCDLLDEYGRIVKTMRSHAETDLNIKSLAKPLWRRMASRIYAWIEHPFGGSSGAPRVS